MHTDSTCQLCNASDWQLHFLSSGHDKVSKLVDHDNDIRHVFMSTFRIKLMAEEFLVILLNIPCTSDLQHIIAMVHECTERLQCSHHLCNISDDRALIFINSSHEMISNRTVNRELHLLRVNEHNLQLVRMLFIKEGGDDGV